MYGFWGAPPFDAQSADMPFQTREGHDTDSSGNTWRYKEVRLYTAAAVLSGETYLINFDGDEETNPAIGGTHATSGTGYTNIAVVASTDLAAATWGWFRIFGYASALCEGTDNDIAKDDYVGIIPVGPGGGTAGGKNSLRRMSANPTKRQANTVAIATEAQAANSEVRIRVFLLGNRLSL